MGILSLLEQRQRLENPAVPISSSSVLEAIGLSEPNATGISVNMDKALGITACWAAIRMISQTIAGLPLGVYEHMANGTRRLATEHPAHRMLAIEPNPHLTPFAIKEMRSVHLLTWGNAYAEIEWRQGSPRYLWPLLPDRTTPSLVGGSKRYATTISNQEMQNVPVTFGSRDVLHVAGMSFDGLQGYNVIRVHREALGMSVAASEYGARFFGNSGRPSGYIKHPGKPGPDERLQLREEWNQLHTGVANAQKTAVLWGNMEWAPISLPPEEAQFLQTRQMQIEEVARIFNINPILLQCTEKATTWGTGVAQFLIAYAKFTIIPWLEREEDALNKALFTEDERGRYYTKYNVAALLRGDLHMQAAILEIKRRNGIINADEWRALDDENPLPDGLGQYYMMPLNMSAMQDMVGPGKIDNLPMLPSSPAALPARSIRANTVGRRQRKAYKALFEDGARRFVRRDVQNATKAIDRAFASPDPVVALNHWIEEFYPTQHRVIVQTMTPIIAAFASIIANDAAESIAGTISDDDVQRFADQYTETLAMRETGSSIGQLRQILAESELDQARDALAIRAAEWSETRPAKVAFREIVAVGAGAVRLAGQVTGSKLVWRANANACPLCQSMNGRTISATGYFLNAGDSVEAEGSAPLQTEVYLGGPPLHNGCECNVQLVGGR